jgi:outer membrane protein assembly factor BamA
MPSARLLAWLLIGLAPLTAGAQGRLPSFDELEAAGAVIGEIKVETHDIFDLSDPHESNFFYSAANELHVTTRPWVIRRMLLFKPGDRVSHTVISETERIIRATSSVYEVVIRPIRYQDGVVDIEVSTRDTWTLEVNASFSRSGGENTGGFGIKESNFLGTGTTIGFGRSKDVDRTGSRVEVGHQHLFDGWTTALLARTSYTDGYSTTFNFARPFYSLDTRWAAGVSGGNFLRNDPIFRNGENVAEYRHNSHFGEAYAGWSPGRVGAWTQRFSVGASYNDDAYALDPHKPPPSALPPDRTFAGPFVRHEVIEDDYFQTVNRDLIERPEYLTMGLHSVVQVGRSLAAFGATEEPWLLSASVSKGFRVGIAQVLASVTGTGQYGTTSGDVRTGGVSARYFAPQTGRFLFYFSAALDAVKPASPADELLLGGDNGVRGYPLRYQAGTRRAVFNIEERYYTDWFPLRLFRVGWALYYDVGRAWDGEQPNATPGWLSNVGFGMRILSARASTGNVVHIDLAVPLHRVDPTVPHYQLVVVTGKAF